MTLQEFFRLMPDYPPPSFSQMAYARYLEQEGLRFCVDFGFENAESLAWDHLEAGNFMMGHA